jgi:hypothetical protein
MTTAESERQRVASALKPKARRPVTPEPDDEDSLLDPSGVAADTADDVAIWKADPMTSRQVKLFRQQYVASAKKLFAAAVVSTDPRVASLGGQVQALMAVVQAMGGKV